jgi:Toastrack DUF4097
MKLKMTNMITASLMVLGATLVLTIAAEAQEYKLTKSTGRLEIKEVNDVTIEGNSSNEIIFTRMNSSQERDERAEGLRAISSLGLEDNTGIGLSVIDKGNIVEVRQLKRMDGPQIKIMVPKGVIVSYTHTSPYGSDITFKNVEGEIEVSTVHNGIKLENVTGPMTLNTVHGTIEADFNPGMKSPIAIASVHGLVDITIPAATKATLSMSTAYGEIFVDPAIHIDLDKKDDDWVRYGSGKVSGKINGGGLDITLSSSHGNIYLRKK